VKAISIKDLHEQTGHWLRRVRVDGEIVVTERGTPVARMVPRARVGQDRGSMSSSL
jgi:prevent-host-death family protein